MRFVFESIIFFILIFSGYWMYVIMRSFFYNQENKPKTKIIRISILCSLAIIFLIIAWGSFIEPRLIKIKHLEINLNATIQPEKIRLAFVSDFHAGPYKKNFFISRVVNKIIKQNPDVILLGGDFIENKESASYYLRPLKKLAEQYPTFAVMGNHEYNLSKFRGPKQKNRSQTLRRLFKEWHIPILDNQTQVVRTDKGWINITGLPEIWTGEANIAIAEYNSDPRAPKILLCHNPEIIIDQKANDFDLILSGHTHGGQVRLPWIGSVPPLPTSLGRSYDRGLFKLKNGYLYITAGIGTNLTRARLFNPPEITIIDLDL